MAQPYQQFSPLNALAFVQQQGEMGRERRQQNQLNQLASLAYSAPAEQRDSILSQAASVDAGAAQGLEKQMAYSDDRRNASMVNMARLLTNAPEQARAGLYRSMVPTLSRFGLSELPQDYNDQTAPIIDKAAQSIVQAYQGANGNTIQSQKISDDGYIINTYRDGRMEKTQQKVDRQAWFRDQPGFAPEVVNKDGTTIQIGGAPGGDAGPQGTTFTTSEGQPFDVSLVTDPYLRQEITRDPGSYGLVPDGARASLPSREMTPSQYNSRTRPSAAQDAAATERAKLQAQQDFLPTELGIRTQADIAKTQGVEQAKSEQERASNERAKTAQLNNVDRGLERIGEALGKLGGTLVDTGPIDGYLIAGTQAGQELNAAVGAIQNDMLALTRVPGIGSQSDLEAKIANLKYPSIYNHPSVNAANVAQLRAFMGDLRRQITGQSSSGNGETARPQTEADFNALPPGALYVDPDDGRTYRKR